MTRSTRLLVAALRELVGQQPALVVGLPAVQRGGARRVDRHRVDQRPLGLARPAVRPVTAVYSTACSWPGLPPQVEPAVAAPDRRADQPRVLQLGQPGGQPLAAGQRAQHLGPELVLRRLPGSGLLAVGVLQPAVGVGDVVAVQILVDVLAGSGGITHYGHEVHFIARIARLRGPAGARPRAGGGQTTRNRRESDAELHWAPTCCFPPGGRLGYWCWRPGRSAVTLVTGAPAPQLGAHPTGGASASGIAAQRHV